MKGKDGESCLSCDDEGKGKLPWLRADAGRGASWWGVGPPVSGSPCLPPLCCGGSNRWSPKVLLLSVQLPPALAARQRASGTWVPCPAPGPPPPQGSTVYRVGSPCRLPLPQTLCCLPVDTSKTTSPSIDVSAGISSLRQNMPSQGLSALKLSRPESLCQLIFHWERERGRDAKLEMLYILMWFLFSPGSTLVAYWCTWTTWWQDKERIAMQGGG